MLGGLVDQFGEWCAKTKDRNGDPIINIPWVRENIARIHTEIETLKVIMKDGVIYKNSL